MAKMNDNNPLAGAQTTDTNRMEKYSKGDELYRD
jgi:hypothetical protein